jgi:hypothetical protein
MGEVWEDKEAKERLAWVEGLHQSRLRGIEGIS